MRVQFCFQFIFPPFSFPGLLLSREDPNSRGSPLAFSLPPPPRARYLVLLFPFSLALLPRVSLRFFRSEPSSPPLTSVYGSHPLPTSSFSLISRRRLRVLSPPPQSLHAASLPSIPFVLNSPLLFLLSPFTFSYAALSFSLLSFSLFISLVALSDCYHLAPCCSLVVVIIKHCENQRQ